MIGCIKATLAINTSDVIGEGPVWDAAAGRLLWMDNSIGTVHEAKPDSTGRWCESRRWTLNRRTGAAIPRTKGGLVVVAGIEVLIVDECGGTKLFARVDADPDHVIFNDAKCDPQGRIWSGTFAHDFARGNAALYRIDPDGTVITMLKGVSVSNGLDWSPDGATFYYIDTAERSIYAFDFDAADGTISRRRTIATIPLGEGIPDGMTVDREGCLWVAVFGGSEVRQYAPDGTLLARVEIPVPAATSCTFGGADMMDLFITSASLQIPEAALPQLGLTVEIAKRIATAPGAGGLFVCRPGAVGKPATPFTG